MTSGASGSGRVLEPPPELIVLETLSTSLPSRAVVPFSFYYTTIYFYSILSSIISESLDLQPLATSTPVRNPEVRDVKVSRRKPNKTSKYSPAQYFKPFGRVKETVVQQLTPKEQQLSARIELELTKSRERKKKEKSSQKSDLFSVIIPNQSVITRPDNQSLIPPVEHNRSVPRMEIKEKELPGAGKRAIASALSSPFCPSYDGTRNFREFISKFNTFANALGLINPERIMLLPLLLRNPSSEEAYKTVPETLKNEGPWEQLITALCDKICPEYQQDAALVKMQSISQGEMSIDAFAQQLRTASLSAFSGEDPSKDHLMRITFINGLNPKLKQGVLRAKPTTFNEAIEQAKWEESIMTESDTTSLLVNAVQRALRPFTQNRMRNMRGRETRQSRPNWSNNNYIPNYNRNDQYRSDRYGSNNERPSWGQNDNRQVRFAPRSAYNNNRERNQNRSRGRSGGNVGTRRVNALSLLSPFSISLTLTLLSLCMSSYVDAYQICTKAKGGVLLLPPPLRKCTQTAPEHVLKTSVHLYVRNSTAHEWDAYRCTKEIHKLCIRDLFFIRDANHSIVKIEPIEPQECRQILRDRQFNDQTLEHAGYLVSATAEPEHNPSRSFSHSECVLKPRLILERGRMTRMPDDSILSDLLLNTDGCLANHGDCKSETSVVIWTPQAYDRRCDFIDMNKYDAIIGDDTVVIPSTQTALVLTSEDIPGAIRSCFDRPVFHTTTGNYITLPDFPDDHNIHDIIVREFSKRPHKPKNKRAARTDSKSCSFRFDPAWIRRFSELNEGQRIVCPYPFLRPLLKSPGIAQTWEEFKRRKLIVSSYKLTDHAKHGKSAYSFVKSQPPNSEIEEFLQRYDYTDPEEALMQFYAYKELLNTTRKGISYLNNEQLLAMISQRMTFEELDNALAKSSGFNYRNRAESIAYQLALTQYPITMAQSTPSVDEVLSVYLSAKTSMREPKPSSSINTILFHVLKVQKELREIVKAPTKDEYIIQDARLHNHANPNDFFPKEFEKMQHYFSANYLMPYNFPSDTLVPSNDDQDRILSFFPPLLDDFVTPAQNVTFKVRGFSMATVASKKIKLNQTKAGSSLTLRAPKEISNKREEPTAEEKDVQARANYFSKIFTDDQMFLHNVTRHIAQDHLQYATHVFQDDLRKHFAISFETVCEIQNKYLELWRSILLIEPTVAMRTILARDDIAARFVGEHVVHVHACQHIEPQVVYHNHTVNGSCYLETPILSKEHTLLFASPGSSDLLPVGKNIPCEHVPTDVWQEQGRWKNDNGYVDVNPMSIIEGFHQSKITPLKFTGINLYTNLSSRTSSMTAAIAYGVSLASIRQNHALHVIHNDPTITAMVATLRKGSDYVSKAKNYVKNWYHKALDYTVGTIERTLISIGIITCLVIVTLIGICICKSYCGPLPIPIMYLRANRETQIPLEPPQYDDLIDVLSQQNQRIPRNIMKEYYPSIITFIPLALPLVCNINVNNTQNVELPLVYITIDNKLVVTLWDSGSSVSYLRESTLAYLGITEYKSKKRIATTANGTTFELLGNITFIIDIAGYEIEHTFLISKDEECPSPALLGLDLMKTLDEMNIHVTLKPSKNILQIGENILPLLKKDQVHHEIRKTKPSINLVNTKTVKIAPKEQAMISIRTENHTPNGDWIYIAPSSFNKQKSLVPTICRANTEMNVLFVNKSESPLYIPAGETCGRASTVDIPHFETNEEFIVHVPPEADWEEKLPTFPKDFMRELDLRHSDLNNSEKLNLKNIILRNKEAFLNEDRNIGLFKGPIEHSIPIRSDMDMPKPRIYRIPLGKQDEIERQVKEMLQQGIIEKSTSLFNSPVVLVKKKDDTYRFVTDFRALNSVTVKQTYVIPTISDIVDLAAGSKYFSTFDLVSGFFQIPLKKSDRHLTSFTTTTGTYQYQRMAMGLCGAPHTFQTAVRYLQSQCNCRLFVYLDDLLVISDNPQQHLKDINELLENITRLGMKIKLKKCSFASREVKFLGLIIGREGIKPDPGKVESIRNYPIPHTTTAVRSFLGMVGFFRKFIQNFAHIASPLHNLTKTDQEFVWSGREQLAFETLKEQLLKAPVLKPPKPNHTFVLESDGSNIAIGAVLLQSEHPKNPLKNLHPIAFASRKLIKAERNYAPIEIEALGLIFAITQFRTYILGTHTICITDHRPLTSLLRRRDLFGRLAKFQLVIQEYDIEIRYREGRLNKVCDALSRYIGDESNDPKQSKPRKKITPSQIMDSTKVNYINLGELKNIQDSTPWIKRTIAEIEYRMARNKNVSDRYCVIDALLYTKPTPHRPHPAIIIPKEHEVRNKIISQFHVDPTLCAHLGINKTKEAILRRFFWTNMQEDIAKFVKGCVTCAQRKKNPNAMTVEPCGKFLIPTKPFERVHMDIMGPFPRSNRNNLYALTMQDAFSKFAIAVAIPSTITEVVIDRFLHFLVYTFGPPARLITDRGSNFMSSKFVAMCKLKGIQHEPTLPHQKNANGQVERLHRTLEECISHYVNEDLSDWDLFLPKVVHTYNTIPSATTGISPYVALFGRDCRIPLDGKITPTTRDENHTERIEHNILEKIIFDKLNKASDSNVMKYNEKHNVSEKEVKKNDFVMIAVKNLKPGHKLRKSYDGPFRVVNVNGSMVQIRQSNGKIQDVHKDNLKIYSRNLSNDQMRRKDDEDRHQLNRRGGEASESVDNNEIHNTHDSDEDEILAEEDPKDPTYVPPINRSR